METYIRKALLSVLAGAGMVLVFINCGSDKSNSVPQPLPDPYEQNRLLGKGINLGNALEAPAEGEWGMTIRDEYFRLIKEAGFDAVRIPIRWNAHASDNPPYNINKLFFERVDTVIQQAMNYNVATVINIHHYNKLMESPGLHKERFLALWRQIAEHYRDYPSTLFFEVLNEPHDNLKPGLWNQMLRDAVSVIRESNSYRTLIIGTSPWGGVSGLKDLSVPEEDRNIIVTVHYYEPFHFTHQGAEWVGEQSNKWLGTTWSGTEAQKQEVQANFNQVQSWATSHNRPIYVGEFGAYSKAPMDSREIWTAFVRQEAEQRGFSWAYWEFGAGFGIYDRETNKWRESLLRALIPGSPELDP